MDLLILKAKSWLTRVHKNIGPKRPNLQPKYLLSGVIKDVYIIHTYIYIYMYNIIFIIIKIIYYIYIYILFYITQYIAGCPPRL